MKKRPPLPHAPGFPSLYLPHRFIGFASYRTVYAKHFDTSVGLIFEAFPADVGSYTYLGDLNNDCISLNDLMYIPKDQDEIVLVPENTMNGNVTDTRSPDVIWRQLDNYIKQDKYLSKHRGKVAERNAVIFPFMYRLDLNITQEFFFVTRKTGTMHTLSVSVDIYNFANLLNKDWGNRKIFLAETSYIPHVASVLQFEGIAPAGDPNEGKPRFSFPYLDPIAEIPYTETYPYDDKQFYRWQAQIGIRYSFK